MTASAHAAPQQQKPHILLRVRTPAAPKVASFHCALYQGAQQLRPWQVWLVHVHALRPVSLDAKLGQADSASLVLHGMEGQPLRQVLAFSSRSQELQVRWAGD